MSDFHVLNRPEKYKLKVVFHYPVPENNNLAGVSIRDIIKEAFLDLDKILDPSYTEVLNGEILEWHDHVQFSQDADNAEIIAAIKEKYGKVLIKVQEKFTTEYNYYGYSDDV